MSSLPIVRRTASIPTVRSAVIDGTRTRLKHRSSRETVRLILRVDMGDVDAYLLEHNLVARMPISLLMVKTSMMHSKVYPEVMPEMVDTLN